MTALSFGSIEALAANDDTVDILASDVRSRVVEYSDLNLTTQSGIERLYRRIGSAADAVCGVDSGVKTLHERFSSRACARAAVTRAVSQIDLPQLNALHARAQDRNVRG
jgi:UrcA family protein